MAELAARLGELQGRLTRLESIGQQVGELAGFDAETLGFDQPVPVGGPVADDDVPMELPQLLDELRAFSARLDDRGVRLQLLDQELLTRQTDAWRWPSGKPTRSGWLSSAYGYRTHPLNGRRQFHRGVDLAGKAGDPVEAVASGVVTWSGRKGGYGILLEVDHRNGFVTRYGHNAKNLVSTGELVKQGQVIATMGSTGRSTGPHVHFEVLKNGKQVNPHKFLKGRRTANLNL
jgi:murein DD-endopeptidase MepM/ murein hydrolase activator NlpD